ncbi:hypothetical protein PR202_gb27249 [Eleusine coracana subsp. coracana]|uniref:Uncharacterized protein n=1 Tax=Eleusine coracana subsp. coracana TaxID=191504 RepID=A0AAV5FU09_ELECO|nr:hypothetical protein PR202_gb27249 [Eleusine coracana subsp. coracana]
MSQPLLLSSFRIPIVIRLATRVALLILHIWLKRDLSIMKRVCNHLICLLSSAKMRREDHKGYDTFIIIYWKYGVSIAHLNLRL